MSTSVANLLKSSVLFKEIADNELSKLAAQCQSKDLSPGETLFYENEPSVALYLVAKGTIIIKKSSKITDEAVTQIGANSHFGEMAMLMKESGQYEIRSATAEASEPSTVVEVPYTALSNFFTASPDAGLAFYRNVAVSLAGRIRRTTEDLAGLRALRLRHT